MCRVSFFVIEIIFKTEIGGKVSQWAEMTEKFVKMCNF